jgi:2'-5' RNA ligase
MTETSSSFKDAWDRFRETNSLRLLQETLEWEWTRGRKEYAAFLVEIADPAAREHIARTIESLADVPGVDPYPEDYWHVTIKGLGFVVDEPAKDDELSPRQVAMIGAAARRVIESTEQFPVTIGAANAFPEVAMLEVNDGGAVRAINQALTSELADLPVYAVDGPSFLPHISIARFSSHEGLDQLKATLAVLRAEGQEGPSFNVNEVKLIQAHLAEAAPTFDTLATYALRDGE